MSLTESQKVELRRRYNIPDPPPHVPLDANIVERAYQKARRESLIFTMVYGLILVAIEVVLLRHGLGWIAVWVINPLMGFVGTGIAVRSWVRWKYRNDREAP